MSGAAYWRETRAQPATCGRCRAALLRAIVEGVPCRVDAVPATLRGELHARLRGKLSYEMRGPTILYREPERIAGGARGPILIEHRCGDAIPIPLRAPVFVAPIIVEECSDGEYPY